MNLERSIVNFEKKLNRVDPVVRTKNKTGLSSWKGRQIIPLDDWIELSDTPYALGYFPDDFDQTLTCISRDEVVTQQEQEDARKWDSDYQELMEYTKNPNYGRLKCFHCLMSPDGDDPIFIGINRLVAKGLNNGTQEGDGIEYPCQIVNRFQCPYERTNNKGDDDAGTAKSYFDVDDLFRLQKIAFVVEIALAKARKDDSKIQIRDKQDLLYVLTDRVTFAKILQQVDDSLNRNDYQDITAGQGNNDIVDYFMKLKNCIDLNELRFY